VVRRKKQHSKRTKKKVSSNNSAKHHELWFAAGIAFVVALMIFAVYTTLDQSKSVAGLATMVTCDNCDASSFAKDTKVTYTLKEGDTVEFYFGSSTKRYLRIDKIYDENPYFTFDIYAEDGSKDGFSVYNKDYQLINIDPNDKFQYDVSLQFQNYGVDSVIVDVFYTEKYVVTENKVDCESTPACAKLFGLTKPTVVDMCDAVEVSGKGQVKMVVGESSGLEPEVQDTLCTKRVYQAYPSLKSKSDVFDKDLVNYVCAFVYKGVSIVQKDDIYQWLGVREVNDYASGVTSEAMWDQLCPSVANELNFKYAKQLTTVKDVKKCIDNIALSKKGSSSFNFDGGTDPRNPLYKDGCATSCNQLAKGNNAICTSQFKDAKISLYGNEKCIGVYNGIPIIDVNAQLKYGTNKEFSYDWESVCPTYLASIKGLTLNEAVGKGWYNKDGLYPFSGASNTLTSAYAQAKNCINENPSKSSLYDLSCSGEMCTNGIDDDNNGEVDCADINQCASNAKCEKKEVSCSDNFDNDADGSVDCNDDDCNGICSQKNCVTKDGKQVCTTLPLEVTHSGPLFLPVVDSGRNTPAADKGDGFSAVTEFAHSPTDDIYEIQIKQNAGTLSSQYKVLKNKQVLQENKELFLGEWDTILGGEGAKPVPIFHVGYKEMVGSKITFVVSENPFPLEKKVHVLSCLGKDSKLWKQNYLYVLDSSIAANVDTCFEIATPRVTFDCNGNSITNTNMKHSFAITASDVTVTNCALERGIKANGVYQNIIKNIKITKNGFNHAGNAIEISHVDGLEVHSNNIKTWNGDAIVINGFVNSISEKHHIYANTIETQETAISMIYTDNSAFAKNTITKAKYGIILQNSNKNTIRENVINNVRFESIKLGTSENNVLLANKIIPEINIAGSVGIDLGAAHKTTLDGNSISSAQNGLSIASSKNLILNNNKICSNTKDLDCNAAQYKVTGTGNNWDTMGCKDEFLSKEELYLPCGVKWCANNWKYSDNNAKEHGPFSLCSTTAGDGKNTAEPWCALEVKDDFYVKGDQGTTWRYCLGKEKNSIVKAGEDCSTATCESGLACVNNKCVNDKPDLLIETIEFFPTVSGNVKFTVTVENIGVGNAGAYNVDVELWESTTLYDTSAQSSKGLAAGSKETFTFDIDAGNSDNIKVYVDKANVVVELDESNNFKAELVPVKEVVLGDSCGGPNKCGVGLACVSDSCVNVDGKVGAYCGATYGCDSGLECKDSACVKKADPVGSSNVVKGDVNGDGVIDVLDVIKTVNHIVYSDKKLTGKQLSPADTNCDSVIDVLDVIKIVNNIVKGNAISQCDGGLA